MNAIRPSETLDNIHSLYVDQWDWEKVISEKDRNLTFLHNTIKKIYKVFLMTEDLLLTSYPNHKKLLPENLFILSSQELEDALPENTPEEREKIISKDKRAVFITHIGGKLNSGISHGNRAPNYDDWNLNGDLIFYNPVLEDCIEISSMGIRVNPETLLNQLKISNHEERKELPYHKMLTSKKLYLPGIPVNCSATLNGCDRNLCILRACATTRLSASDSSSKIAAEAADVANGLESAWKKEQEMGKARKEFDWEKQFSLAFDKSKPRAYRNKCELDDNEMCAMCGEYCSVKISKGDF